MTPSFVFRGWKFEMLLMAGRQFESLQGEGFAVGLPLSRGQSPEVHIAGDELNAQKAPTCARVMVNPSDRVGRTLRL